jgi:hypothetical protein
MAATAVKVGDRVATWFSDEPDGRSTVLAVAPYRGKYPQWFALTVRLTAPRTRRGWMEMCIADAQPRCGAA